MVHALVPLKDLVGAKTRLAGILSPSERRALAQAMVEDVLAQLTAHPMISAVTLLSDDPGAGLLAGKYNIELLDERSLGCTGLNAVLNRACEQIISTGAEQLVVLHGDLPLLSSTDLDDVVALLNRGYELVLGCDRHRLGTNLLAFPASCLPEFAFGLASCARHRAEAVVAGRLWKLLKRPGIGLDVDEPADLELLMSQLQKGATGLTVDLLLKGELKTRIDAVMMSMEQGRLNTALNDKVL
ncbi:MAG: 2-phospho-L-lactate guanylyltransferase [Halioglobus sp.]